MKYQLYAIEIEVSSSPVHYELMTRLDENGSGSPLTWPTQEAAEEYIGKIRAEAHDPELDIFTVVPLSGETDSEDEEPFDFLLEGKPR